MAIIDILTPYDTKKKAAHAAKTVKHGVSLAQGGFWVWGFCSAASPGVEGVPSTNPPARVGILQAPCSALPSMLPQG